MLPSNSNLSVQKTAGYNSKLLISNTDMKTGSNRNTNNIEVHHQVYTKSRSLVTLLGSRTRTTQRESHAILEMHAVKSIEKSIKVNKRDYTTYK